MHDFRRNVEMIDDFVSCLYINLTSINTRVVTFALYLDMHFFTKTTLIFDNCISSFVAVGNNFRYVSNGLNFLLSFDSLVNLVSINYKSIVRITTMLSISNLGDISNIKINES